MSDKLPFQKEDLETASLSQAPSAPLEPAPEETSAGLVPASVEKRAWIIGAGLAGSEAAWQLASRGIAVTLFEMKPETFSPAHRDGSCAELVCSNSLGSQDPETGAGLLQEEGLALGSLLLRVAQACGVPAGRALAVDRIRFARGVTAALEAHPLITIARGSVDSLPPQRPLLVATGPLTHPPLAAALEAAVGTGQLYFYDAIAPIILGSSIDQSVAFSASRWEDGPGDYLNCPLSKEEYDAFVQAILEGEQVPPHAFEEEKFFQSCQPIEAIAASGHDALSFGPMKPVGLSDPRTGRRPHAVVQLRREDREGSLWNMVGFQTRLKHGPQTRIFRMIPGLQEAEFVRLGSVHRNTFLNAPAVLTPQLSLKNLPGVYLGGQLSGVEGYLESTLCGLMAALYMLEAFGLPAIQPPPEHCMLGGLLRYLREAPVSRFQPINANFGLLPPPEGKVPRKARRAYLLSRARHAFDSWRPHVPGFTAEPPLDLQALVDGLVLPEGAAREALERHP